jgi:hypothetical protein
MRAARAPTPGVLALAARVVGIAARLVPTALRDDWAREWNAELWSLYRVLELQGRLTARDRAALVLRSAGSVLDALHLRLVDSQLWSESFAGVVTRWGRHSLLVPTALLFLSAGIAADTVLIAFGKIALADPRSGWSSLASDTRSLLVGIAIACGLSLIVASAAAAAQLLGSADPAPDGSRRAWIVELLLVAGVTGWVGRWFAAFGVRVMIPPHAAEWLAAVDLDAAVTAAWVVSWALALTALTVLRLRRRARATGLPR